MRVVLVIALGLCWAMAAWCTRGTLAVTGGPDAVRLGVLPALWRLGALAGVGVLLALVPAVRRLRVAPLWLSALVVLPWIPGAPVACLTWTGPLTGLVWGTIAVGLVAAHDWRLLASRAARAFGAVRDPARAPWVATAATFVVCSAAAWSAAPSVPGGDEPHYLVITQSLLHDFDLKIENNHRLREYASYAPGTLEPAYWRRGKNGAIYSIHEPGLAALVAPAFALGGYRGVEVFLLLVSALGSGLAWRIAYRLARGVGAAWFGWAAVTLSTTFVFHSFTVYPDGVGAVLTLVGVWALVGLASLDPGAGIPPRLLVTAGTALAALPWLHQRFALIAGVIGMLVLLRVLRRGPWRRALASAATFLAVPVVSAAAWLTFFYVIYGEFDPLAPYGTAGMRAAAPVGAWAFVTSGLGGIFFDQQFGLLAYAPVLGPVLLWLFVLLRDRTHRRLALEIILVMIPYLLSVTHFRMWWAGWSAPARFLAPLLLPLVIPAAILWQRAARRVSRSSLLLALWFTAFATACLVSARGGRLAFNVRDGYALWLDWLSRVVDLPLGLPSFFRAAEGVAFIQVAIWLACLAGAWLLLCAIERAGLRSREALAAATPGMYAVAVMIALSLVWRSNGATGVTPTAAQLDVLRATAAPGLLGVQFGPLRRLDPAGIPQRLAIDTTARYLASRDRPLFVLPEIPAGDYRLRVETTPARAGTLWIEILPNDFRVREFSLAAAGSESPLMFAVAFPVNVRAIIVQGDAPARSSVTRLTLLPQSVVGASSRPTAAVARRAVHYPAATVYFFDGAAFPEPDAFWVRGANETSVAIDAPGGPTATLFLRNAPVENRVLLESENWREDLTLAPGEERTLALPRAPSRSAVLLRIRTSSGFRPSEVNRASQDHRFLGVWVQPR